VKDSEFRNWLAEGGAESTKAQDVRISSLLRIERNLDQLGFDFSSLDEAYAADQFASLLAKLADLRMDARMGGDAFRVLLPQSQSPERRLSHWESWLKRYGRFLAGEVHGNKDADRIRRHVLEKYIEPARERDEDNVEVHVLTINNELGLNDGWPNICQALVGQKFLSMADLPPPERIGAEASSATRYRFDLSGAGPGHAVIDRFRKSRHFEQAEQHWTDTQRADFLQIADAIHGAGLDWWFVNIPDLPVRFGRKSLGSQHAEAVMGYLRVAQPAILFNRKANGLPLVDGEWVTLAGDDLRALNAAISDKAGAIRDWYPQVPIRPGLWPDELREQTVRPSDVRPQITVAKPPSGDPSMPTNLILYGPPGTGKTFSTAREAVRLCDGTSNFENGPASRSKLMARYRELVDQKRIAFITFHQNFSYEDFVEGLRPQTSGAEAAGFRLEPEPGVFRRIVKHAQTPIARAEERIDLLNRKIFKLSLGDTTGPDAAWVFDQAIDEQYAYLGFTDIDWSDPRYASKDEILKGVQRWRSDERFSASSGPVKSSDRFRNHLQVGDVVIVSRGLHLFRAIGIVEGPYEFAPRSDHGRYAHRRKVCGSAWKRDPGSGVIGVEKGPLIPVV